jgi:hypothetical protein
MNRNANDMVTFLVGDGDKEQRFIVHKEFACHSSPTLAAAFNSNFLEGRTRTYHFRDVTEVVIQFLVQWIYMQRLEIFQLEAAGTYDCEECKSLFELWVLADQLLIPKLQNFILYRLKDIIIDKHKLMPIDKFDYVYQNTAKESKIRLLFLHLSSFWMDSAVFSRDSDQFPKEMLVEVATLLGQSGNDNGALKKAVCAGNWTRYEVPED